MAASVTRTDTCDNAHEPQIFDPRRSLYKHLFKLYRQILSTRGKRHFPSEQMSNNQVLSSKSGEQKEENKFQKRAMTLRICPQLTTFVVLMLAVSLSTRISEEVRRGNILSTVTRFTHLFAFGTWLGIQFWATFIAGKLPYMFFTQPWHAYRV